MNFDLSQHLPFQLAVLSNYIKQSTSDPLAKAHGMTGRDWRVMAIVGMHQPITPATIAEITGIDRVTVTRSVQHLQTKGLVTKIKNKADGRSVLIKLSKQGQRHWQPMALQMKQHGDIYRNLLTPGEFTLLLELLSKLKGFAEEQLKITQNQREATPT